MDIEHWAWQIKNLPSFFSFIIMVAVLITSALLVHCFFYETQYSSGTQQDYYGRQCSTLLHSYCTSTYTEVKVLLLLSSSNATLEYPHTYSNRVAVWVLHGNSRVTSQEQHGYFSVVPVQ